MGSRRGAVAVPSSRWKVGIASVLKREGFVEAYSVERGKVQPTLTITLKYGREGEMVINEIQRTSRPGRRRYCSVQELPRVLNGMGMVVVSTPRGVLSDRAARKMHAGGEGLCTRW